MINRGKRTLENAAKIRNRKARQTREENFDSLQRKSVDTNANPPNETQFNEKCMTFDTATRVLNPLNEI